jgi:hypothetical protein
VTRTTRDHDLDRISYRADRAADIVPTVRRHLAELRATSATPGANGDSIRGSDVSDPTLGAVLKLDGISYRVQAIADAIASLNVGMRILEEACRDALGYRGDAPVIPDTPQCVREFVVDEANGVKRRCDNHVEHYTRSDGTIGYRSSGHCVSCRKAVERASKAEAAA